MLNLYEFVALCQEEGLSASEAEAEYDKAREEAHNAFLEDYYSRPDVCAGWAQQDVIDMYRKER